jgi:NitT/TauT family transport system ATP-binding protein
MDAVRLHEVTHVYVSKQGAQLAVEQIDLTLKAGEFVSIVGPSGCGKSTLLSIISGLLQPTSGTVTACGEPVTSPSTKVGYMLQQDYLFPWRTILDNAVIGLELTGKRTKEAEARVRRLLADLGLADTEKRYPSQLSGGMRQRVALVRTLAVEPELLLLDEPFSALDYQIKLQLEDLVWTTLKARGTSALLVTHDIGEAIAMSDRVVVMDARPGRIRCVIDIPVELRSEVPFRARALPQFQLLFDRIWHEFESSEGSHTDGTLEQASGREAGK